MGEQVASGTAIVHVLVGVGGAVDVLSFCDNLLYFTKQFTDIQAGAYVRFGPFKAHIYSTFFVLWQLNQGFLHV